jgi:hypothetical protein
LEIAETLLSTANSLKLQGACGNNRSWGNEAKLTRKWDIGCRTVPEPFGMERLRLISIRGEVALHRHRDDGR